MAIQHVNRKGDRYYLQAILGKDGKPRYSFTRKLKGEAVDAVPQGYEIYEEPGDAQVFLRKSPVTAILPAEKETVESAVRCLAKVLDFVVDVEKKALVVYVCETDDWRLQRGLDFWRTIQHRAFGRSPATWPGGRLTQR